LLPQHKGAGAGAPVGARSALTLLDWAANEVQEGRVILSSTGSGTDVHRLVMPELATARRKR
jgi:hypothetical protein